MININNKRWNELTSSDIKDFIIQSEESYFLDFKQDEVNNVHFAKTVASFSNSYGGYIFVGINDNKEIVGSDSWSEERISSVIRDRITPLPIFDIKKFEIDHKNVWVIKIEEGFDTPYITNDGMIYERISSGSVPIKDSTKLNYLYQKKKDFYNSLIETITIPSITEIYYKLCGYLDIGFYLATKDTSRIKNVFFDMTTRELAKSLCESMDFISVTRTGYSFIISINNKCYGDKECLPAHTSNFIEMMNDGSVRLRFLFIHEHEDDVINLFNLRNTT